MKYNYFSWIPNTKIIGTSNREIQSTTLNSIYIDDEVLKISLKEEFTGKFDGKTEFTIIKFNENPGIHSFNQPDDEDFPLELAYCYSIDLLEHISRKFNISTIMYPYLPKSYFEGLFGLSNKVYLPFLVRRPKKTLYTSVFLLTPITGNLLVSLESFSDQYEDYIDNALYTFQKNVVRPLRLQENDYLPEDLIRVLDRSEDLYSIVVEQIENIRERYRAFSRLVVPLIHYATLRNELESSISFDINQKNQISFELHSPKTIESNVLASFIASKLAD